jgi:hypothetical protein
VPEADPAPRRVPGFAAFVGDAKFVIAPVGVVEAIVEEEGINS